MRVTLVEASDRLGGTLRSVDVAGLRSTSAPRLRHARRSRARARRSSSGSATTIVPPPAPRRLARRASPGRRRSPKGGRSASRRTPGTSVRADHRLERRLARLPRPPAAAADDRPGAQPRQARAHAHGRRRARPAGRAGEPRRLLGRTPTTSTSSGRPRAQRRADPHRLARAARWPTCSPAGRSPGRRSRGIDGGMSRLVEAAESPARRARRRHPCSTHRSVALDRLDARADGRSRLGSAETRRRSMRADHVIIATLRVARRAACSSRWLARSRRPRTRRAAARRDPRGRAPPRWTRHRGAGGLPGAGHATRRRRSPTPPRGGRGSPGGRRAARARPAGLVRRRRLAGGDAGARRRCGDRARARRGIRSAGGAARPTCSGLRARG